MDPVVLPDAFNRPLTPSGSNVYQVFRIKCSDCSEAFLINM